MKTLKDEECVAISEATYPDADWDNKETNIMFRDIFREGLIKARDEIEKRNKRKELIDFLDKETLEKIIEQIGGICEVFNYQGLKWHEAKLSVCLSILDDMLKELNEPF